MSVALEEAGRLADTDAGRKSYGDYLAWQAAEGPVGKSKAYVSMSKGWALGAADFKASLIKDHALVAQSRAWENEGAREIRERAWKELFRKAMGVVGRKERDLADGPKSASWKVAMAVFLKERTQVSNPWLAERLRIGRPVYVSRLVSAARQNPDVLPELAILRERCKA